jgi:hypothetical protein
MRKRSEARAARDDAAAQWARDLRRLVLELARAEIDRLRTLPLVSPGRPPARSAAAANAGRIAVAAPEPRRRVQAVSPARSPRAMPAAPTNAGRNPTAASAPRKPRADESGTPHRRAALAAAAARAMTAVMCAPTAIQGVAPVAHEPGAAISMAVPVAADPRPEEAPSAVVATPAPSSPEIVRRMAADLRATVVPEALELRADGPASWSATWSEGPIARDPVRERRERMRRRREERAVRRRERQERARERRAAVAGPGAPHVPEVLTVQDAPSVLEPRAAPDAPGDAAPVAPRRPATAA